ncbi:MAG: hypothetical protein SF123_05875 [Chloroflexota bacterium]|nr:hypothetical protein [Chloroflexota bacterium]
MYLTRSHPVLAQRSGFTAGTLLDEMQAAQAWGKTPDEYFALERSARALMVAEFIVSKCMAAIAEDDRIRALPKRSKR